AAITVIFKQCYSLASTITFPFLTLQMIPELGTLLFYIGIGITLLALTILLITTNRFLLQTWRNQYKLVTTVCLVRLTIGLLCIQLVVSNWFLSNWFLSNWLFIIVLIYFGFIFVLSYLYFKYPSTLRRSSPLRNAAIFSFILAVPASTLIYQAQLAGKDE